MGNLWIGVGIAVAVFGVFLLPWHVPLPGPVIGEAYAMGYNNRVAVIAVCVALAFFFLGLLRKRPAHDALGWIEESPDFFPPVSAARAEYAVLAAFSLLAVVAVLVWNQILVDPYWGESGYFLSRIDFVCLGFKPYKDFLYNYGPLPLYLPVWIDRLSFGLMGIENAYALVVALGFVAGFAALFVFLRALSLPAASRPWILAVCLAMWCMLTMGLQYVPLRFTILPFVLVFAHRWIPKLSEKSWIRPGIAVLAGAGCFLCFSISAEMGTAAALAFLAYAVVLLLAGRLISGLWIVPGIFLYLLCSLLLFGNYLKSVAGFGSGAFSFPIYPTAHILLFLSACFIVLPQLAAGIWSAPSRAQAPLAAALAMGAVVTIPAALGRCDPGHIQANGLVVLTLLFPAFASVSCTGLKAYAGVFAIICIGLMQLSYWNHYAGNFKGAWSQFLAYAGNPSIVEEARKRWDAAEATSPNGAKLNWHKPVPFPEGVEQIVGDKSLAVPLPIDVGFERFMTLRKGFRPLYHTTRGSDMFSPAEVYKNIVQCDSFDLVLIPTRYVLYSSRKLDMRPYEKQLQDFLSGLLLFPVNSRVHNSPFIPEIEFSRGLVAVNEVIAEGSGLTLFRPHHRRLLKSSAPSPTPGRPTE